MNDGHIISTSAPTYYTMGTLSIIKRYDIANDLKHDKPLVIKPEPAPGTKEYNARLARNGAILYDPDSVLVMDIKMVLPQPMEHITVDFEIAAKSVNQI